MKKIASPILLVLVLSLGISSVTFPKAKAAITAMGMANWIGYYTGAGFLGGGILFIYLASTQSTTKKDMTIRTLAGIGTIAIGLAILDSSSDKIAFSELSDDWSLKLGVSPEAISEYNANLFSLNAASESFIDAYNQGEFESNERAIDAWNELRAATISADSLDVSKRLDSYVIKQAGLL